MQQAAAVIPAGVPVAPSATSGTAVLKTDATTVTTHVMQVLVQLPNGQTVPVQIPAAITPQALAPIGELLILFSFCHFPDRAAESGVTL